MAITLFDGRDLSGNSQAVTRDIADLRNSPVGYGTSSLEMTDAQDRCLLFLGRNWTGRVMLRRGVNTINRIGNPGEGGRTGFNNSVRSVRVTPFRIRVFYHVIRSINGNWPGGIANQRDMNRYIRDIHARLDDAWGDGLFVFVRARTNVYDNARFFNMRNEYVALLRSRAFNVERFAVNAFLVNSIAGDTDGISVPRQIGYRTAVEVDPANVPLSGQLLAHEIGHMLGLGHRGGGFGSNNLMEQGSNGTSLRDDQYERAHRTASNRTGRARAFRIE